MDDWWKEFMEPDGLILRDRVLATVDPDKVLVALRSGRLRRVQRGIYVPRDVEYRPLAAARAAIVSSGVPDAVASHTTAGRIHGLALPDERRREDVTVPREMRKKDRADLRFHTRALTIGDVGVDEDVPFTSVPRTLADLASDLDRVCAVWMLDDALRRELCRREAIHRTIGRWKGGSGGIVAEQRLAEADGVAESILETAGRLTLSDAGAPLPEPQYKVCTPGGKVIARLDGAYVRQRIGIEYDGVSVHEQPDAVLRDRERQNALVALGWTLLRFTWWDVTRDPSRFVSTVQRVVAAAS